MWYRRGARAAVAISSLGCHRNYWATCDDRFVWRRGFPGQLTPERTADAALQVSGGPFNSRWVRVGSSTHAAEVLRALDKVEKDAPAAVYVGIMDNHPETGGVVASLRARGYDFHHAHTCHAKPEGGTTEAAELIYQSWMGSGPNMVPQYATCLEGVGGLILSPDRTHVLLVWEYGHWKVVTGNVDSGEGLLEALRREAREELNVVLSSDAVFLGGWQQKRARDERVNVHFSVFGVTSQTLDFAVDQSEITEARWLPLSDFPTREEAAALLGGNLRTIPWDFGIESRGMLSYSAVQMVHNFCEGRGLTVSLESSDRLMLS